MEIIYMKEINGCGKTNISYYNNKILATSNAMFQRKSKERT